MNKKRDLAVFSVSVAKSMMLKGHYAKNISENKKLPGDLVFYFEDTLEARETLNTIIKQQKERQ